MGDDAESVSSPSASRMVGQIKNIGTLFEASIAFSKCYARYYALQKDNRTSA